MYQIQVELGDNLNKIETVSERLNSFIPATARSSFLLDLKAALVGLEITTNGELDFFVESDDVRTIIKKYLSLLITASQEALASASLENTSHFLLISSLDVDALPVTAVFTAVNSKMALSIINAGSLLERSALSSKHSFLAINNDIALQSNGSTASAAKLYGSVSAAIEQAAGIKDLGVVFSHCRIKTSLLYPRRLCDMVHQTFSDYRGATLHDMFYVKR